MITLVIAPRTLVSFLSWTPLALTLLHPSMADVSTTTISAMYVPHGVRQTCRSLSWTLLSILCSLLSGWSILQTAKYWLCDVMVLGNLSWVVWRTTFGQKAFRSSRVLFMHISKWALLNVTFGPLQMGVLHSLWTLVCLANTGVLCTLQITISGIVHLLWFLRRVLRHSKRSTRSNQISAIFRCLVASAIL